MFWRAARLVGGTAAAVGGGWALRALQGAPEALGASPVEIDGTTKGSPNYRDGVFVNLEPASAASLTRQEQFMLARDIIAGGPTQQPPMPVPLVTPDPSVVPGDLAATWYGHSSVMIEVDGYRILADPVWSDRCSPSRGVGPQRLHPVPAQLEALPAVDAVIISHDHYDHLDVDTIKQLALTQRAKFFVPLGIGAHLRTWRIPAERIVELDWNESAHLGELELVCTPARHFSGRFLARDLTLWSSWAIIGPRHRAFFGGDTGYTKSFVDIGSDYGPFDLTLMPVGAYHPGCLDIHMNPEDAVRAHRDVTDGGLLVPIHWATFRLALHPWSEPVERLLAAADGEGVAVATPKPGQRIESAPVPLDPWWRT
ncbi:MAG TPA: MBL fold metallo-hydrolase [Mycobacterium sp.]|nr:MBL fold metallo-hydrolase [Mycobacterium sp.]